jgi:hypothetical protein
MPEREVKQVLASYRDPDGVMRYGLQGEVVDMGADDVDRFDEEQGDKPKPVVKKAAAKKR